MGPLIFFLALSHLSPKRSSLPLSPGSSPPSPQAMLCGAGQGTAGSFRLCLGLRLPLGFRLLERSQTPNSFQYFELKIKESEFPEICRNSWKNVMLYFKKILYLHILIAT